MPTQDEITALRRLMESVNNLSASNSKSLGKLAGDLLTVRQEVQTANATAARAIQMCNDLAAQLKALAQK